MASKRKGTAKKNYRRSFLKGRTTKYAGGGKIKRIASLTARREIKKMAEKKVVQDYQAAQTINTCVGTTNLFFRDMMPTVAGTGMSQGTGSAQRIGNKIRVVFGSLKCYVSLKSWVIDTNPQVSDGPILLKFWLVSFRQKNAVGGAVAADFNDFFQLNNAAVEFQGDVLDMELPVNQDKFKVHATRRLYLCANSANPGNAELFNGGTWGKSFRMSLKPATGVCMYNDQEDASAIFNKNLWLVGTAVSGDQNGGLSTYQPARITYAKDYKYIDM